MARHGANKIVLGIATATLLARREELKAGGPGSRIERSSQTRVINDQLDGIKTIERGWERRSPASSGPTCWG
ncbi:MAG: hypothetical protein GEU83_01490 [Pseudonocardiaceae bacterium]|nr:hypothetical protein [Pseudonocardiaceae bacterium]